LPLAGRTRGGRAFEDEPGHFVWPGQNL
jgi:hypothetical protein